MDGDAALDLVAETFAAAFVGRKRFRGSTEAEEAGFLLGIARHQLSHWYRRGRVRRKALERLGVERPSLDDESYSRIEELARLEPTRAAVREALASLSEEQREALRLRVIEERDYPDVASALGIREDAARARVSRALRALNARLGELEGCA